MNCEWKPFGDGQWQCALCGEPVSQKKKYADTPPPRNCKGKRRTKQCKHLGPPIGFIECPTCQGNVRLKVFACGLHGQCTVAKVMDGIACCATCRDYSPRKDVADESGTAMG